MIGPATFLACNLALALAVPSGASADSLSADGALVTLIEEVEVPARAAGVLSALEIREGDLVKQSDVLGRVDDEAAKLAAQKAKVETQVAQEDAGNDVHVRAAEKALEVARAELRRAQESVERYKKSISETELDKLRLTAEHTALEIEQAEHERTLARLHVTLRNNEQAIAEHDLAQREIRAPIAGMVIERLHQPGEWVEPGETVLRMVRLDRLRVEVFLDARRISHDAHGRAAVLAVEQPEGPPQEFKGQVAFVSPEVDPVNGQVRVWVEVANDDLRLRPGIRGTLRIEPPTATAAK